MTKKRLDAFKRNVATAKKDFATSVGRDGLSNEAFTAAINARQTAVQSAIGGVYEGVDLSSLNDIEKFSFRSAIFTTASMYENGASQFKPEFILEEMKKHDDKDSPNFKVDCVMVQARNNLEEKISNDMGAQDGNKSQKAQDIGANFINSLNMAATGNITQTTLNIMNNKGDPSKHNVLLDSANKAFSENSIFLDNNSFNHLQNVATHIFDKKIGHKEKNAGYQQSLAEGISGAKQSFIGDLVSEFSKMKDQVSEISPESALINNIGQAQEKAAKEAKESKINTAVTQWSKNSSPTEQHALEANITPDEALRREIDIDRAVDLWSQKNSQPQFQPLPDPPLGQRVKNLFSDAKDNIQSFAQKGAEKVKSFFSRGKKEAAVELATAAPQQPKQQDPQEQEINQLKKDIFVGKDMSEQQQKQVLEMITEVVQPQLEAHSNNLSTAIDPKTVERIRSDAVIKMTAQGMTENQQDMVVGNADKNIKGFLGNFEEQQKSHNTTPDVTEKAAQNSLTTRDSRANPDKMVVKGGEKPLSFKEAKNLAGELKEGGQSARVVHNKERTSYGVVTAKPEPQVPQKPQGPEVKDALEAARKGAQKKFHGLNDDATKELAEIKSGTKRQKPESTPNNSPTPKHSHVDNINPNGKGSGQSR